MSLDSILHPICLSVAYASEEAHCYFAFVVNSEYDLAFMDMHLVIKLYLAIFGSRCKLILMQ